MATRALATAEELLALPDDGVRQWLGAGTRPVRVVSPATRSVTAYAPGSVSLLGEPVTLDGGDVLPGFSRPVPEVFG